MSSCELVPSTLCTSVPDRCSPWWAWVLVGLAILYLFNIASGSIYSRKLWNMIHDEIVKEDKTIQEEIEKKVTRLDSFLFSNSYATLYALCAMPFPKKRGYTPVVLPPSLP